MDQQHASAQIIDRILLSFVAGLCGGIILSSFDVSVSFGFLSAGGILSLVLSFIRTPRSRRLRGVSFLCMYLSIALFSSMLGSMRMDAAKPDASAFSGNVGTSVTVQGVIDAPSEKTFTQNFTLSTSGGISVNISTKKDPMLRYGDEVSATGVLLLPQNFQTDYGTDFDYVSYLYKDDILYQMKNAKVSLASRDNGSWIVAHLAPLSQKVSDSFSNILSARDADLLGGLVLGTKENISPQFRDALVATGTIHIIALSGYNVTIVADTLRDLLAGFAFIGPRLAQAFGILGIIIFVLATGAQSSAIRAGIMAVIGIFARGGGRAYDAVRALAFAGTVMILYDPKYLVFDVSFQLSFLATLGIIFLTPILERKLAWVPKKFLWKLPLRELIVTSLGAQIAVLPFILYKMGTLSIIALPANMAVLPAVPLAMGIGFSAGMVGLVSITLAWPLAFAAHLLLSYITAAVTFFANVPYAMVVIKQFPIWICLAMYGVLIWIVVYSQNENNEN